MSRKRATTFDLLAAAAGDTEALDLGASEIACELSDVWAGMGPGRALCILNDPRGRLSGALDRLEKVTRHSAMRKVKPSPAAPRTPTIYEALRMKLGREPTHGELATDVRRILAEGRTIGQKKRKVKP